MKFTLLVTACLLLSAILNAQETQSTKKPVRVETEHVHKGASHEHTRTSTAPMEHRSTSSWHYHSGAKRPQVPVEGQSAAKDTVKR